MATPSHSFILKQVHKSSEEHREEEAEATTTAEAVVVEATAAEAATTAEEAPEVKVEEASKTKPLVTYRRIQKNRKPSQALKSMWHGLLEFHDREHRCDVSSHPCGFICQTLCRYPFTICLSLYLTLSTLPMLTGGMLACRSSSTKYILRRS